MPAYASWDGSQVKARRWFWRSSNCPLHGYGDGPLALGCPSGGPHVCVLPQCLQNQWIDLRLDAIDRGIDSAPYALAPRSAGWDLRAGLSKEHGPKQHMINRSLAVQHGMARGVAILGADVSTVKKADINALDRAAFRDPDEVAEHLVA